MMDGTPRQTVSSRRGTSSHADEDDEDAAALGIEDDDDIDDAKYYTLRLSLQELPSCGIAYALAMACRRTVDLCLRSTVYGVR